MAKRKYGIDREPNGQARRLNVEQQKAFREHTAKQHPARRAAFDAGKDPLDARLGFFLTRLEFWNVITKAQCRAGLRWAGLVNTYRSMLGLPNTLPRQVLDGMMAAGEDPDAKHRTGVEPDPDDLANVRSQYDLAFERLQATGRGPLKATRDACLFGLEADVGDLRVGLNALIGAQTVRRAA